MNKPKAAQFRLGGAFMVPTPHERAEFSLYTLTNKMSIGDLHKLERRKSPGIVQYFLELFFKTLLTIRRPCVILLSELREGSQPSIKRKGDFEIMSYFTKNTRIMVIDTETANTHDNADMSDVQVYDCGWAICDIDGNVYETASYVNSDIFYDEPDLMESAYYAKKIPGYMRDLAEGKRKLAGLWEIRRAMFSAIERYGVEYVAAYNARFDANALNRTIQWVSKSFARYFFRFNQVEWLDIMKMAQDAIVSTRNYKTWATDRGFTMKNGAPRKTAEMIYRYMTGEDNFKEDHTGLEDVLIEVQIMAFCFSERDRRKVKMRTKLYENPREWPEMTAFQRDLMRNLKENPVLRVGAV